MPHALAQQAAASSRRLDDTFRGYLTERGAKTVILSHLGRPDGKVVTVYYFNDGPHNERFIEASIWDPDRP